MKLRSKDKEYSAHEVTIIIMGLVLTAAVVILYLLFGISPGPGR